MVRKTRKDGGPRRDAVLSIRVTKKARHDFRVMAAEMNMSQGEAIERIVVVFRANKASFVGRFI